MPRWRSSLTPWLSAAVLLHLAVFFHLAVFLAWRLPQLEPKTAVPPPAPAALQELELVYDEPGVVVAQGPSPGVSPDQPTAERLLKGASPSEPTPEQTPASERALFPEQAPASEASVVDVAAVPSGQVAHLVPSLADVPIGSAGSSSNGPPAQSGENLGETQPNLPSAGNAISPERLAQLGYGAPNAHVLRPHLDFSPLAAAQERLDQHLTQALLDQDRDRSVGIEGPVTNALHTAAMSVVAPRSVSKVAIIIGRDGKLADFRIVETNRDARALQALKERVQRLLANQTVRVPNGRPVEFIYEIKSEVLLPSGRAPGFGVEVLGQPLKKSPEAKSSKLSILKPVLEFKPQVEADPEHNGKITQTLPQLSVGISLLELDADPVDIAANARQVVRTRLLRQRVL